MIEGRGFHPICFCCGADVENEAGLQVFSAPLERIEGFDGVAAAWRPPAQFAYLAAGIRTGMLGRMTGRMIKKVPADQDCVVIGWCLEVERNKHFAATALFDAAGDLCGYSEQVWIGRRD